MQKILFTLFLFTECSMLQTSNDLDMEIQNNDFIEEYVENKNVEIKLNDMDSNSKAELFKEIENFLQNTGLSDNFFETCENKNDKIEFNDIYSDSKAELFQEIENFLQNTGLIENFLDTGKLSFKLINKTNPNPLSELSAVKGTNLQYSDVRKLELSEFIKIYLGDKKNVAKALNKFCNEMGISEEGENNETF